MRHDVLADVLSKINNAERVRKKEVLLKPVSNVIRRILKILNQNNYVGDFEYIDDKRGGQIRLQLISKINKCAVIKPRIPFKKDEIEKYEKRYLPAKSFGFLIVSTSKGIMTHEEARKQGLGGILLAYVY